MWTRTCKNEKTSKNWTFSGSEVLRFNFKQKSKLLLCQFQGAFSESFRHIWRDFSLGRALPQATFVTFSFVITSTYLVSDTWIVSCTLKDKTLRSLSRHVRHNAPKLDSVFAVVHAPNYRNLEKIIKNKFISWNQKWRKELSKSF